MTKNPKIKILDKSLVSLNAMRRRNHPKISLTISRDAHSFLLYLAKKTKSDLSPAVDAFIMKYAEKEMAILQK
jgi:uncharacterized UBP type Zn finger protein